jgi:hypothetical protein
MVVLHAAEVREDLRGGRPLGDRAQPTVLSPDGAFVATLLLAVRWGSRRGAREMKAQPVTVGGL